MPDKYKAQLNKLDSGIYLDVYTEANSQHEAEQIFKAQYPEYRIIGTHKVESRNDSAPSNSGCAGVVAALALLPLGCVILRFAA